MSIFGRGHSGVLFKELMEDTHARKIQFINNFFDWFFRITEQIFSLQYDIIINPLGAPSPGYVLDDLGQIFRGQAHLVSIELHISLAGMVLCYQFHKLLIYIVRTRIV